MADFIDVINPEDYDKRNICPELLNGQINREEIRKRLLILHEIFTYLECGFQDYFDEKDFFKIRVPNITSTIGACENWRTLFRIDHPNSFFHLLTQTGQLFLEGALIDSELVWCITKSFRKEEIEDSRHLCEFNLLEIEGGFTFETLIEHMINIYRRMLKKVLDNVPSNLCLQLRIDMEHIKLQVDSEILTVTYSDCVNFLKNNGTNIKWGNDFEWSHEKILLEYFTNGKLPIFVTHFPKEIKFFNMAADLLDESVVLSVDFILPYSGEAAGGAQRENRYDILKTRLEASEMYQNHLERGGTYNDFKPYMDLIATGMTPTHSGAGFGIERIIQNILKCHDIRLCSVDYLFKILFAWDALNL